MWRHLLPLPSTVWCHADKFGTSCRHTRGSEEDCYWWLKRKCNFRHNHHLVHSITSEYTLCILWDMCGINWPMKLCVVWKPIAFHLVFFYPTWSMFLLVHRWRNHASWLFWLISLTLSLTSNSFEMRHPRCVGSITKKFLYTIWAV